LVSREDRRHGEHHTTEKLISAEVVTEKSLPDSFHFWAVLSETLCENLLLRGVPSSAYSA